MTDSPTFFWALERSRDAKTILIAENFSHLVYSPETNEEERRSNRNLRDLTAEFVVMLLKEFPNITIQSAPSGAVPKAKEKIREKSLPPIQNIFMETIGWWCLLQEDNEQTVVLTTKKSHFLGYPAGTVEAMVDDTVSAKP